MSELRHQFARFAAIGAAAFFVDAGVLYAMLALPGVGYYLGRLVSWTAAASFTWYLNRRWTFRGAGESRPLRQWLRFLGANAFGGLVNYGVYAALIVASVLVREYPVIGVGAGSLAGLALNFGLSRALVFRRSDAPTR